MKGKGKFGNFFSNKNPEIGSSSVISTLSSWLQHTIKPLKKVHGYTSYSFKLVSHTHYICKSSFWFPSSRPLNDFVFFSWKDVTKCGSTLTAAAEVTTDVKFFGLVKPRSTWICIKWPGAGGGTLTRKIKPDAKRNNFQSWFFVCLCVSLPVSTGRVRVYSVFQGFWQE